MEVENIHKKASDNDEKKKKTKNTGERKPRKEAESRISAVPLIEDNTTIRTNTNSATTNKDDSKIRVSMFDYSVENHLREMSMVYKLCGEDEHEGLVDVEIERLASAITFLSEWRYFNYNPRTIRFVSETGGANENEAHNEITLSQFSAAMVPNCDLEAEKASNTLLPTGSRKDFVLYVGGLVWSLDWCPRIDQESNSSAQCEYIAVAAHPPDSSYHRQGAVLSGRGMIQIWCVLSCINKEDMQAPVGSTKRRYKTNKVAKKEENKPVRPRGRPRKNAIEKAPAVDPEGQITQALVVHLPEKTLEVPPDDESMLSIQAPQDISTPVCEIEKYGCNAEKEVQSVNGKEKDQKDATKQKKPRGKAKKYALDNTLVEDPEGQFISAHAVRFPEDTLTVPPMDKTVSSDPGPKKGKEKRRKVVKDVRVTMDEAASISTLEGPSYQALAIEFPENIKNTSPTEDHLLNTPGAFGEMGKRRTSKRVLATDMECTLAVLKRRSRNKKVCNNLDAENSGLSNHDEGEGPFHASVEDSCLQKDDRVSEDNVVGNNNSDWGSDGFHMLKNDVLPRVVLCLGHDGKVAWDVKWRPRNAVEVVSRHRMGYLAVVLGNGYVEVWEVPCTQVINCIYASRRAKGTDPRFAKLKPVFRCSLLKYGDRQSMPLTVEWSAFPPHDLLLAGCHDGVVALWKFSVDVPAEDTKPLLCFSAETGPIRSLSWAPYDGDPESSNIIVTAGHGGLKFWDLRDPFRPLWDANPSQRFLYGLDWVPDPRCVLVSYDDGTLRMLSLSRAAYDVPVTGQAFSGTQQQGLHSYHCSSFAVWSIHVSRRTGMVAYCCADGTVLYFQLTHKAVDKDPLRNRAPHFLCGSMANEEPAVTMNTQLPGSPHRMKKSATEWANTPRPARTVASGFNQSKRSRKGTEKSQKPDDEVLALCYDDDTGNGDPNETPISDKGGKGKTSKSKKTNNGQALICTVEDGDGENTNGKPEVKDEDGKTFEVFPPKIVSMYRVRWNMNKGSERWLCYGGAAGIVRCQEIVAPEFDKKSIRR